MGFYFRLGGYIIGVLCDILKVHKGEKMVDINGKLNELYKRSFDKCIPGLGFVPYNDVIRCGIISPKRYEESNKKLVIILKEGWASGDDEWNWPQAGCKQVERVRCEGHCEQTWQLIYPMGRWNYLVQERLVKGQPFKSYKDISCREAVDWFEGIGITNIKKVYGRKNSKQDEISQWGKNTSRIWKKELEIMNPYVVICGGIDDVYEVVTENLKCSRKGEIKVKGKSFPYSFCSVGKRRKIRFIGLCHPSQRDQNYNRISYEALKELRRKGFI